MAHGYGAMWDLLWTGEQAFWKAVPHLLAAGYHTAEELTEPRRQGTGRPYKIPWLRGAQVGACTQTMRIILSRGIGGIDERTRGLTQRWFDMVDWRSAQVRSARLGVSLSIEGYAKTLESEVSQQHPARTWVERQEGKSRGHKLEQLPTTSECGHHLLQMIMQLKQGALACVTILPPIGKLVMRYMHCTWSLRNSCLKPFIRQYGQ